MADKEAMEGLSHSLICSQCEDVLIECAHTQITRYSEFRLNYILGLHPVLHNFIPLTSIDLRDAEVYGLGTNRNVEDFWNFTRIDIYNLTKVSPDLCPEYKKGGMHPFRIPWKDEAADPYGPVLDS